MSERVVRKISYPLLDLVFRCSKKRVWMSIESVKEDDEFMHLASLCIRKPEYNGLCDELCHMVNSIYKIKEDKNKIMNLIKSLKKEEEGLAVLGMSLELKTIFNKEELTFQSYVTPNIHIYRNLKYIQDELQFDRLWDKCVLEYEKDGILNKIDKMLIEIYKFTAKQGYDIFASFEGDEL